MPLLVGATGLQGADFAIIALYMIGMLAMGLYLSRQKSEEDYYVANRAMPWWAVGLSLVATLISTLTYLGTPGEVIQYGISIFVGYLAVPPAMVLVMVFVLPFAMRLKCTSIYEYLEYRYGLAARWLAVGLFVIVLRLGWMAVILVTASRAVGEITYAWVAAAAADLGSELDRTSWTLALLLAAGLVTTVYTILGGIKAVIWTDVVQFVVLFGGILATLGIVAYQTGTGWSDWWERSTTVEHQRTIVATWDITERTTFLWACLNAFFWHLCTFCGDQVAMQRYFTTPSTRAAVLSTIVQLVGNILTTGLLAVCGMALLVYYERFPAEIAAGIVDPTNAKVADRIFPHFIAYGLPVGASGLVIAGVLAVAMSSLDSGINSVAAVLTVDVVERVRPQLTSRGRLALARWLTLVLGLVSTLLAWWMLFLPDHYNILGITLRTFNCALGPLAAFFLVGMFLPYVGQAAIVLAVVLGFTTAVVIAWWTELGWYLGLIDVATLEAALDTIRRPSPYLVIPISAVVSVLLATVVGVLLPRPDRHRVAAYTWKGVVLSKR